MRSVERSRGDVGMNEARIVKKIQERLRARGANVLKLHGGPFQPAGLDLFGCAPAIAGRMFVLEVKQPGEDATPRQTVLLEQWRQSGAIAGVVRSADEAEALVFGAVS